MLKEKECDHCKAFTGQIKTIHIEGVAFSGHPDCMEDLKEMCQEGRHSLEEIISYAKG